MRFHASGVVFLVAALVGWAIVVAALGFVSAACAPSPGNPVLLHLGVAAAGVLVVAVPARWAWRAHGWRYRWRLWLAVAVLVLAIVIYAAVTVSTPGCPFVF